MNKNIIQFVLSLVVVFAVTVYAQYPTINPGYTATLANDAMLAPNQYEFDIILTHTGGGTPFELQAIQIGMTFNKLIANGGTLSAVYIAGTSQLVAGQVPGAPTLGTVTGDPNRSIFRVAPKAALTPGDGTVITGTGKRVGRFRISTSASVFNPAQCALITWNFLTTNGRYPTKVAAWLENGSVEAVVATDITVQSSHFAYIWSPWCLPVELSSLTATIQNRDVKLKWETKTETNSLHFEVERATVIDHNRTFNKVGEVVASGNSNSPKYYSFIDKKMQSGKFVYRLKMVDVDGSFEYSKEVEIEIALPIEYVISQNYPNPFNPTTKIDYQLPFDSMVTIDLYGITGEKIATLINGDVAAGYYSAEIDAGKLNLASGVYAYRINAQNPTGQNFVGVRKLVLTK